jgi:hypothetical protein
MLPSLKDVTSCFGGLATQLCARGRNNGGGGGGRGNGVDVPFDDRYRHYSADVFGDDDDDDMNDPRRPLPTARQAFY